MKRAFVVLTLSAGIIAANVLSAFAGNETQDSRLRSGAFVGVHFVYSLSDFDSNRTSLSADDAPGVEVFGGYRFNRYVSLEGLFHYTGKFDVTTTLPFSSSVEQVNGWGFTIMPATKVYPLVDVLPAWVQPYGMFGVGALIAYVENEFGLLGSDTAATAAFRFGGGVDFYLIPQLILRAGAGYVLGANDLEFYDNDIEIETNYVPINVGLEFRF